MKVFEKSFEFCFSAFFFVNNKKMGVKSWKKKKKMNK